MACVYTIKETGQQLSENEFKAYLLNGGLKTFMDSKDVNVESIEEIKQDPPKPPKPPVYEVGINEEGDGRGIDDYEMKQSDEIGKFSSGGTLLDVFGETPEGNQSYYVQKLSDMLQDGKNMIAKAQAVWGTDILDYGKKLFQHIQGMSNDAIVTNKKAVLMATFLGEMKDEMNRNPEKRSSIQPLYNVVEDYYQTYMNVRGKEVVAGRLLRLYRDKYMADIFVDAILEDSQKKQKQDLLKSLAKTTIDEDVLTQDKSITEEQKQQLDNEDKKASEKDKKQQEGKKSLTEKEIKEKVASKQKELEDRFGKDPNKKLSQKINDLIKRLNCK